MTPRIVISLLGTCSSSSSSSSGGMSGMVPYKPFLSMVGFLRFLEIDFEGDNRRKEKGTPELLFVCNDGKTIEEQKHNNHYLYIICSSYAWPSLKVIWPVHTAVQPPQPHYFFVPTKASVVVVVHTSNGRRSSRGPELLTQKKKKRGEGLFKNYFDVVSREDLKATKNEGFYLISKFFLKKLRNFFSWIGWRFAFSL